jgi:hypothetical protein
MEKVHQIPELHSATGCCNALVVLFLKLLSYDIRFYANKKMNKLNFKRWPKENLEAVSKESSN